MWFWYLLCAIVALVINVFVSQFFANIAYEKGHTGNYFWWCFLLGVVGYVMVAALPDLEARPQVKKTSSIIRPSSSNAGGASRTASGQSAPTNTWKCPNCSRINANYVSSCVCGKSKH